MTKAECVACYRHKHCGGDIRIKTKHYVYVYLRYRRKKEYDNATFTSDCLNIGELNLVLIYTIKLRINTFNVSFVICLTEIPVLKVSSFLAFKFGG